MDNNRKTIKARIWITLIVLINGSLIWYLRHIISIDGNDKAIIQYLMYYPLIVLANIILFVFCRKSQIKVPLMIIIFLLLFIFLPIVFTTY